MSENISSLPGCCNLYSFALNLKEKSYEKEKIQGGEKRERERERERGRERKRERERKRKGESAEYK